MTGGLATRIGGAGGGRLNEWRRRVRLAAAAARIRYEAAAVGATVAVSIDPTVTLEGPVVVRVLPGSSSSVTIGPAARLGERVRLDLRGGSLSIGARTEVRRLVNVNLEGVCRIGEGVLLNQGIHLHCADSVTIGDRAIIGEHSTITDSRHLRTDGDEPVQSHVVTAPTVIGANCWFGAGVVVASGVTVGDHCFIGAHAVVTSDIEPWWLAAGSPARPIRRLTPEV